MRLILIGHMSVRVELDGMALLTDPWFGPRTWLERQLAPRTLPPALSPDEIPTLDALLVSHHHIDHLDEPALALARRLGCTVIGSEKAARRARRAGIRETVALRPGEKASLGPLTVHAVPADHPLASDAVGFVVLGSQNLYFSGDTRWTPHSGMLSPRSLWMWPWCRPPVPTTPFSATTGWGFPMSPPWPAPPAPLDRPPPPALRGEVAGPGLRTPYRNGQRRPGAGRPVRLG